MKIEKQTENHQYFMETDLLLESNDLTDFLHLQLFTEIITPGR